MAKEPQSYGSNSEWVKGNVGQEVNRPRHIVFYENRLDSETSGPDQGGHVSGEQLADNAQLDACALDGDITLKKVPAKEGGAKVDSYFKKRDYE